MTLWQHSCRHWNAPAQKETHNICVKHVVDEFVKQRQVLCSSEARDHGYHVHSERRSRINLARNDNFEFFGDPCARSTTQEMHEDIEDELFQVLAKQRVSKFR